MSSLRSAVRYCYRWIALPSRLADVLIQLGDVRLHLDRLETQVRQRAIYLGGHLVLCKTLSGHKMYIDTRDRGVGNCIMLDGFWEKSITEAIRSLLRPGMNAVEVGANIGYHAVQVADVIGPAGKLWAFEPNPGVCELLRFNLYANEYSPRSEVIAQAAGRERGQATLTIPEKALGSASLGTVDAAMIGIPETPLREVTVSVVPVDEVVPAATRIDFVKIDAEGSEPDVLAGMTRIIGDNPSIIIVMEFAPGNLRACRHDPAALIRQIEAWGFPLRRITEKGATVATTANELLNAPFSELVLQRAAA